MAKATHALSTKRAASSARVAVVPLSTQSFWRRTKARADTDAPPKTNNGRKSATEKPRKAPKARYERPRPLGLGEKSFDQDPLEKIGRFSVWLDRERAVICDCSIPLEQNCRVLWIENGWARGTGKLTTEQPGNAQELTVQMDPPIPRDWEVGRDSGDYSGCPNVRLPRTEVVRVIGSYEAFHERGMLPKGNGLINTTRLPRSAIYGDGTPLAFHKVTLPRGRCED